MSYVGPYLSQESIKINIEKQVLIFIWYMVNSETHRLDILYSKYFSGVPNVILIVILTFNLIPKLNLLKF